MARKVADCRRIPSEIDCSLTISGEEDEVLRAAEDHAVSVHGEQRGKELREMIRAGLVDEDQYFADQGAHVAAPAY